MSKNKKYQAWEEYEDDRVIFTEAMRKDYTILFPDMLPRHFKILTKVFQYYGYKTVLLEPQGEGEVREIISAGLRNVHNDACYPILMLTGQFIHALESGKYDVNKTAIIMTQTGGGCRASNYISLIRKALKRAGFPQVPVISLNFAGLEKNPGFKITWPMIQRAMYAILYGDLILTLVNQTKPYEKNIGDTEELAALWTDRLVKEMTEHRIKYSKVKKNYEMMVSDFASVERTGEKKIRVGIVGEIFVKFSPLANNNLEQFLINENAEPVMAGMLDFALYCIYNPLVDRRLYGKNKLSAPVYKFICKFFEKKQDDMYKVIERYPCFIAPSRFFETCHAAEDYVGIGMKMGEGWLLPAEMMEMVNGGVANIVCTQPFGCLPNHIIGKGMMKPIKEKNPGVNIVAIDYDSGAARINQENRIKLMLANAMDEGEKV